MKLTFPSTEFDDVVAAVCHGSLSDEQARALNQLLRTQPAARDEYLFRVELHARLASDADLFLATEDAASSEGIADHSKAFVALPLSRSRQKPVLGWVVALAACLTLLVGSWWEWRMRRQDERKGATSKAVAMLNEVVDAQWSAGMETPRTGGPLDPGWLRLKSGLAQVVFYSGARVVIEGPAEFQIISPTSASCQTGRLMAEVPPQARGFSITTPHLDVTDRGTAFGLDVRSGVTEVHVFKGRVDFQTSGGTARQILQEGSAAVVERSRSPRLIPADATAFASLSDLRVRSVAAESSRHDQWRAASLRLDEDPSLLVHFDFEPVGLSDWRLPNASIGRATVPDGTIVGCQWVDGRWPTKHALEFRGVSDRVRLNVPGEFESFTLASWVRVQGLDRQFNSLFMCDGFDAGTLHWLIRDDGVLGLTVIGSGAGHYQIATSPPVLSLDQFGLWLHLAVVVDGNAKRVSHYLNGQLVSEKTLKIPPPFHIGTAELGNWNGRGFPADDPFMIRNFSGAMDEFCLFSRALPAAEIYALFLANQSRR